MFYHEPVLENLYQISLESMKLRCMELLIEDSQIQKMWAEKLDRNRENSNKILYY